MRWRDRRRSTNIDDRRGQTMKRGAAIGGGGIIMALVAIFLLGKDPGEVLQGVLQQQQSAPAQNQPYQSSEQEEAVKEFMSVVMADTEDTWGRIFQNAGQQYPPPTLVIYTGATQTACGVGQAASGPFYCPGDQDIYIDMAFLNELQRMGASGDFAVAYVLAHEVGHHIQTITGTSNKVRQMQARASKAQGNDLQVRMELQADCYAGVWANHTQQRTQFLERGDIQEAIQAAASVGDDTIMKRAGIPPRKENFTHGTSEQRMQWFNRGIQSGDVNQCDTGI
ncbi:MAG: neutral zinc metallopeptidase [Gammaproteobacteria bacterium]|nr:neutral zinc metallopeptidase [Gammaproteobacteria bacterium]